jgi:hypothetical protein
MPLHESHEAAFLFLSQKCKAHSNNNIGYVFKFVLFVENNMQIGFGMA